jgi:hypothetical protein
MKNKKPKPEEQAEVHEELKGFSISVNEFGEIITNTPISKLNNFLDKHVRDKKLVEKEMKEKKILAKKEKEKTKKKKK